MLLIHAYLFFRQKYTMSLNWAMKTVEEEEVRALRALHKMTLGLLSWQCLFVCYGRFALPGKIMADRAFAGSRKKISTINSNHAYSKMDPVQNHVSACSVSV